MNPAKTRADELLSLGRRSVAAIDAAAPAVNSGIDVSAWDQVLVAVSGDAAGLAEILIYGQFSNFIGATEGPVMVPLSYLRAVPIKDHTGSARGNAVFVLNTMKSDAVFPSVITFSGATAVYINVLGLTKAGATLTTGAGVQGEDDADVFDTVDITKVGGQTLLAHGAAATTIPLPTGARATAGEPADVDASDVVLLSATLGSRLRVNAIGNTADDAAADALSPVKVGAVADAAVSLVSDGDQAHLVTDLYRRLRSLPEGASADDAADTAALNPVKVGGIAISHLAPDVAQAGDMVHLSLDLYRRARTLPEGPIADDAASDATNPVKVGAVALDHLTPGAAVTAADMVHLTSDLYRRLRVMPEGPVANDAAADATNPVKVGGVAYTPTTLLTSDVAALDIAHLAMDLEHRLYVHPMGYVADDSANNADDLPVKIGVVADQVLGTVADGDMVHLTADLSRQLRVVGAAYDSVSGADRAAVNTIADDRDEAAQTWANETLAAADAVYYPSSVGYEVGNRTWLTLHVRMRHGTLTFQSSNDGTNWEDTTQMLIDRNTGMGGYAGFTEADSATIDYMLEIWVGARYCRALWTPGDATSIIAIYCEARVR